MAGRGLTVEEIMAILPETPRRIATVTDGLTRDRVARRARSQCLVRQ